MALKIINSALLFFVIAFALEAQTQLNVTSYGAVGNAIWTTANVTSNSFLVTTTNTVPLSIGEVVEIFSAGPLGTSTNHQDLLATITNITQGTNLYVDTVPGATVNSAVMMVGSNNETAFQSCINAAPSNSIINIPNGIYLIIGSSNFASFSMPNSTTTFPSLVMTNGGITFLGQSETGAVLLSCGAWQNKGSYVYRGFMFKFDGPVINNGPVIFDGLTIDGGVLVGDTGNGNFPASTDTGDGWDNTHKCFFDYSGLPMFDKRIIQNCHFMRWRGEMMYSQIAWDSPTQTSAWTFTNDVFSDGDATALNLSAGNIVINCTFSNLYEVCEFYEANATNQSSFSGCVVTNMFGALMAFNGASSTGTNPTKTIYGNTFYLAGSINGIQTTPCENLIISNNNFIGVGTYYGTGIALGVSGYQGTASNSNIIIEDNVFTNIYLSLQIEGSGQNAVYNVQVNSNFSFGGNTFASGYGWSTNVTLFGNSKSVTNVGLNSTMLQGQWYIDQGNSFGNYQQVDNSGITNVVSYEYGAKHQIIPGANGSIWVLDDTNASHMPPDAYLYVTNSGIKTISLYTSASMSQLPKSFAPGNTANYIWRGTYWDDLSQPRARIHF